MLDTIDFTVEQIQHVIERYPNPKWEMNGVLGEGLYVLGIALNGKATYTINSQSYTIQEGGLVLVPPCAHRSARSLPEDPWHFITIGCQLQFPNPETKAVFDRLPLFFPQIPDSIRNKAKEIAQIWNTQSPARFLLAKGLIYGMFYDLITDWDRQQWVSVHHQRIQRAQQHIERHYASEIRQHELAALCGYSESHFRRLFSEIMGMSCSQYILRFRIDSAKNLLLSGTVTVSEAASMTGFSDVYHFSKMFKRITGHSPSHYKQ